jgi:hypothetical protein
METIIKEYNQDDLQIIIRVIDYEAGSTWFAELYEESDHIGGTTVTSESANGHYIGQTTPAELAKDYAKQGRSNPSKEAYDSLSEDLEHYIQASDCALKATVYKNGIELAENQGISFDFSYVYHNSHEEEGLRVLTEYGDEFIKDAIKEAHETLEQLAA